ncbi:MAG: penicillin-binding protein 2 [Armatimonadetes bacterium]|nr:penicillin-binding protein 2 [Armatimonadota bacterium]
MEPKQLQVRLMVLRAGLMVALAVLAGRLWCLQIAGWSRYQARAEHNRTQLAPTPAPRGTIYDRNGEALADNQVVYQVQVVPSELPTDKGELDAALVPLARVLGVSTVEARKAVDEACSSGSPEVVLPGLGENIDRIQAIRLEEHRLDMPGLRVIEARRRHYPFGTLAAHVIGYARAISPAQFHEVATLEYDDPPGGPDSRLQALVGKQRVYAQDSIFGQTGVESLCELVNLNGRTIPALQGRRGADESERDASNEPRLVRHIPAIRGASVYLTIDRRLQQVAERALAYPFPAKPTTPCEGGAVVLLDVERGDILAMASCPTFDLDEFVLGDKGEIAWALNKDRQPQLNRAIAGLYPAASTFKIISSCAILERTKTTLNTTYVCTGRERFGRRGDVKTCWKESGHGPVDFLNGVALSCDVYFWDAVKYAGLTADQIAEHSRKFGLGEPTGIGLPGEQGGLVPTPAWRKERDRGRWYQGDTANLVIGQGDLKVTPLQMALAAATIANRGRLPKPRIVNKIVWPEETGLGTAEWPRLPPRDVGVKPETVEAVRQGMRSTVTHPHGTARGPMAGLPVTVAAKTGSGEVSRNPRLHSWFVWFAPYEKPKYACAVIVEFGGYGASVAGYVARKVLLAAFSRPTPQVAARPPEGSPHAD